MVNFDFKRSDIDYIQEILEESSIYSGCDIKNFLDNLAETCVDAEFRTVLRQFLNHAAVVNDIVVRDTSLTSVLEQFEDQRLGVLIALPLLFLEKTDETFTGISALAAQTVIADRLMLANGEPPTALIKSDIGWFAINDHTYEKNIQMNDSEEIFKEAALWSILLAEPLLIHQFSIDYPEGTQIFVEDDPDKGKFLRIYIPEEEGGGDE